MSKVQGLKSSNKNNAKRLQHTIKQTISPATEYRHFNQVGAIDKQKTL
jgi:hypothetical protein